MRRIRAVTNGILFRIWVPIAVALTGDFLAIALYYPARQADLYRRDAARNMKEVARLTALGVEFSLQRDDYASLASTMRGVTETDGLAFAAVVINQGGGEEVVLAVNPDTISPATVLGSTDALLRESAPFGAGDNTGRVVIGASLARVNADARALNGPVYGVLALALLSTLAVLAFVARSIARPVRTLTNAARDLQAERYDVAIPRSTDRGELGQLTRALADLRDALAMAKARDAEFNESLVRARRSAEAADAAKSAFVANMSHEMRTPINAMLGLVHLSLQPDLAERRVGYLKKIDQAARSLLALVEDVLDFSKVEAGALVLEQRPFSLDEVLLRTQSIIADSAAMKGLEFDVLVESSVPNELVGDALRLQQVLINLLGNAVKFTTRGSVSLHVSLASLEDQHTELGFAVRDTGVGLSEEQRRHLFKPFSQADVSSTRVYGGTGLGLVISQRLVQAMNGSIHVSSRPGAGSTFRFVARFGRAAALPTQPAAAPTPAQEAFAPAPQRRTSGPQGSIEGKHILVVEDNEFNQEVITELLHRVHAKVHVAPNGAEAVKAFDAPEKFDLVLMDIQMPVMDGFEATRRLRAGPYGRNVPILAITANVTPDDRQRCQEAGMDDFLAKPVLPDRLYTMVRHWIESQDEPDALPAARVSVPVAAAAQPVVVAVDPAPMPQPLPVWDPAALRQVSGDDDAIFSFLLSRFLDSTRTILASLQSAIDAEDVDAASKLGHQLKSTAAQAGVEDLRSLAERLDRIRKDGITEQSLAEATALVRKLHVVFAQAEPMLRRHLGE